MGGRKQTRGELHAWRKLFLPLRWETRNMKNAKTKALGDSKHEKGQNAAPASPFPLSTHKAQRELGGRMLSHGACWQLLALHVG